MSNTLSSALKALLILTVVNWSSFSAPAIANTPTRAADSIAVVAAIVVNGNSVVSATTADVELIRAANPSQPGGVEVGTPLFAGDEIKTKSGDQLTLRFTTPADVGENLVYMDPDTHLSIGSACLRSGRILAWVGINFKVCIGNTTLGVKGTEFVVSVSEDAPLKINVLQGEVELIPPDTTSPEPSRPVDRTATRRARDTRKVVIPEKTEVIVNQGRIEQKPIPIDEGRNVINYWTRQMIRTDSTSQKGREDAFLNYKDDEEREQAFIEARFDAVWNSDPKGLETVGRVYNDWAKGQTASKALNSAVKHEPSLAASPNFQTNLAEADRLSGNYASATNRVSTALKTNPDYSPAYYVQAKILLDQSNQQNNSALKDDARAYLSKSLQVQSRNQSLDRAKVEQELDTIIKQQGQKFLTQEGNWVSAEKWWCQKSAQDGVMYSGTVNLPQLKTKGVDVSGPATLFIVGNQFKLKTQSGIHTGTIVGKTSGQYTAVALRFDDPKLSQLSDGISISLREQGTCGQLRLEPVASKDGGIVMTAGRDPM